MSNGEGKAEVAEESLQIGHTRVALNAVPMCLLNANTSTPPDCLMHSPNSTPCSKPFAALKL